LHIANAGYFDNPVEVADAKHIALANPKNVLALIAALEQAQQDGKEKSSSKEGFIEADRFKIPPMPEKVSAYDMRETLNVPMFEDEAQASANGFNQCLLECKPIHEAAKRMSRGIDELLKEMDAMQENINHKQKTISILRDRSESAEKRIAELDSAPNGMMQLSNELAEMKRKCAELQEQKDKWAVWAIALGAKADELESRPLCVKSNDAMREAAPLCVKPRIDPHQYRECINELTANARKYGAAGQLRERLSYALSKYVEPDHPHTRTSGGTVEGGE
jgi:signal transduction histidine kinase